LAFSARLNRSRWPDRRLAKLRHRLVAAGEAGEAILASRRNRFSG
jgi:hypothetical protein